MCAYNWKQQSLYTGEIWLKMFFFMFSTHWVHSNLVSRPKFSYGKCLTTLPLGSLGLRRSTQKAHCGVENDGPLGNNPNPSHESRSPHVIMSFLMMMMMMMMITNQYVYSIRKYISRFTSENSQLEQYSSKKGECYQCVCLSLCLYVWSSETNLAVFPPRLTIAHSKAVPTRMATKAEGTRVESLGKYKETTKDITWDGKPRTLGDCVFVFFVAVVKSGETFHHHSIRDGMFSESKKLVINWNAINQSTCGLWGFVRLLVVDVLFPTWFSSSYKYS